MLARSLTARATLIAGLALLALLPAAEAATDWTWTSPAAIGSSEPYVHVAAVGTSAATAIVVGAHAQSTADAWIAHGGMTWSALAAPPAWAVPPTDPVTGLLTPGSGYGCAAPALASAPDGRVLAACISGVFLGPGPFLTAAELAPGSAGFSSMPLGFDGTDVPVAPALAVAGDGTVVGRLTEVDGSGHNECVGLAWRGTTVEGTTWAPLQDTDGLGMSVAAGADGSALVSGVRCVYNAAPSGLPRLVVSARRGSDGRWTFSNIARNVSVPSFSAVAPNGRLAVAWEAGPGVGRWASVGSAVRPAGSLRWTCRPLVGHAGCAPGVATLRPAGVAALPQVHLARIYALVALPDDAFVMLFSAQVGRPAHRGGLFYSVLAPGSGTWSRAKGLDAALDEDSSVLGDGPAAVAIDEDGGLVAAWPHKVGPGSHGLRIARLADSRSGFVREADLAGTGFPFDYQVAAPPDGPPSVVWIDRPVDPARAPAGRVLTASATR